MSDEATRNAASVSGRESVCAALHRADRGLLCVAEFFFGPRESWKWWQRKLRKAGLL